MSIEDIPTPQSLEAAFHCAIKNLISKPMQPVIMAAFRQVMAQHGKPATYWTPRLDLEGKPFGMGGGPIVEPGDSRVFVTHQTCPFCGINTDSPCHVPPAGPCEQAIVAVNNHVLFTDNDAARPDAICDRNGQVVLGLCKVCGKADAELESPCK
jgi:hypothetical protein